MEKAYPEIKGMSGSFSPELFMKIYTAKTAKDYAGIFEKPITFFRYQKLLFFVQIATTFIWIALTIKAIDPVS